MKKEAIILIPGLDAKEAGSTLKKVVQQLAGYNEIETSTRKNQDNHQTQSIEVTFFNHQEKKTFDLYEVFWGDIINENYNPDLSLLKKLVFGFELIVYWFFSKIWKAALKNKFIFVGICFSGIVIIAWYSSIIALVVSSLSESGKVSQLSTDIMETLTSSTTTKNVKEALHEHGLGKPILAVMVIIMGFLPTGLILKMSGFTMKYLKSQALREKIKNRIEKQMNILSQNDEYDRITVFSHSMGTLPALEFFADFKNNGKSIIRSITTGAPASFLTLRSPRIEDCLIQCAENQNIDEWWDYFSTEDYMCSYRRINNLGDDHFQSIELNMDSSWLTRLTQKVHLQYYDDPRIIEKLILD